MPRKKKPKRVNTEKERKRMAELLELWRYLVDFRAHYEYHYPSGIEFNEIEAAEQNIDEDIEDVFEKVGAYEFDKSVKMTKEKWEKKRERERKLLRAAVEKEIERMKQDTERVPAEILDLGIDRERKKMYESELEKCDDIGERCCICRRSWPLSVLEPVCTCTKIMAHRQCLEERLRHRCSSACELCGRQYRVQRQPRYSPLRGLWTWFLATASKFQLLLAVFLAALVVTKAVLLSQFILHSTITGPESPRGNHTNIHDMVSELWTVSKQHWKHMVLLTHLPGWFLPLAILVFLMHAGLAVIVSVSNIKSFRTWYCRTARVTILGGDQPSSGDHEPAK